jgi:hypothetical protein
MQSRQCLGAQLIIVIQERNPLAAGGVDSAIARGAGSQAVLVPQDAASRAAHRFQKCRGGIRGAIVHHDHLVVVEALRGYAAQRPSENVGAIVSGNDDAERRRVGNAVPRDS